MKFGKKRTRMISALATAVSLITLAQVPALAAPGDMFDATTTASASTEKPVAKKRRICNVIEGTVNRPSYLGPLLDFSSWGNRRLLGADLFPVGLVSPSFQYNSPLYYSCNLYSSWYGNWYGAALAPLSVLTEPAIVSAETATAVTAYDPSIPDATRSGLRSSDRVEEQVPYLSNEEEIPDTRGIGTTGDLTNVLSDVF